MELTAGTAPHLLIVDDERPIRVALRRWFSHRGWRCTEAETLAAAEQHLFGHDAPAPDVILCDLNLPDGTGEDLLGRLERDRPALVERMILATGATLSVDCQVRLAESGCRTLPKPFDLAHLERVATSARRDGAGDAS